MKTSPLLLIVLPLLAGLSSCDPANDIDLDLPNTNATTGTEYIDTLTVRTSTVLVDSVATTSASALLMGRYTDARLVTLTARGFARLGLTGGPFEPAATARYDSLVLVLAADRYRYGDTTRTQEVSIHRLRQPLRATTTYYAFSTLPYDA